MLKCEKSFFRNETHYSAILAGQGNAKENYSDRVFRHYYLSRRHTENIVILLSFVIKKMY